MIKDFCTDKTNVPVAERSGYKRVRMKNFRDWGKDILYTLKAISLRKVT